MRSAISTSHQARMLDRQLGTAVALVAGDHHVRVEIGVRIGDEELHVGDEGVAARALEVRAKSTRDCQRMSAPDPNHREHLVGQILVLVRLRGLPVEVGLPIQRRGSLCRLHFEAPVDVAPLRARRATGSTPHSDEASGCLGNTRRRGLARFRRAGDSERLRRACRRWHPVHSSSSSTRTP